jgi:hypothetical protein
MARRILVVLMVFALAFQLWWSSTQSATAQSVPEGGFQPKLSLTIAPPSLVADGRSQFVVYIQLLEPDGTPSLASEEIRVSLISSHPGIAGVPDSAPILPGQSYTVAPLTTTSAPGKATITAVIPGYSPDTAEVETFVALEAEPPFRLDLEVSPGKMISGSQPPGRLSVTLMGANGQSLPAPQSLNVVLSSSNPDAVRVPQRITIPKGAHFAITDLEPLAMGSATLSAVHEGYATEFVQVQVVEPGKKAEALALYLLPPVLSLEATSQPEVIVQAVDGAGAPVHFPCADVTLTSSSPGSVEALPIAGETCASKSQFVTGALMTGRLPGVATITAVAPGIHPAAAALKVQGQVPAQVRAYLAPEWPLEVEAPPGYIVVQVLDGNGVPVSTYDGIRVTVVGGGQMLQDKAVIAGGRNFVALELGSLQPNGQTDLWFVNPDLSTAHLSLNTQTLPITIQLVASEEPIFPGDQVDVLVQVESGGSPLAQAKLTWTAGNGMLNNTTLETDGKGQGRAAFMATNPGDDIVKVTVEKAGYEKVASEAVISVVAAIEASKPRPSLLGIPVLYFFLATFSTLLGYLGIKFLPSVARQAAPAILRSTRSR